VKISIYGHFGSQNHGNEAIVRGIFKLFTHGPITLYSFTPQIWTRNLALIKCVILDHL